MAILALRAPHRLGNDIAEQMLSNQWHVEDPAGIAADGLFLAAELLAVVTRPAG
jgi:hypothetical protein